ncbi:MAG: dipeptide ABC transporter ATP-binding protein [Oscillospiraceae bacterium]
MDKAYFELQNLQVGFRAFEGDKPVLDIGHLAIQKGEAFGLVGESGAGKTVLAQTILRLLPSPPCILGKDSHIWFDGQDLLKKSEREMRESYRGRRIAMIFQDPMSTLNPVFTVGRQISDVIRQNHGVNREQAEKLAVEMLEKVKMADSARLMKKYPHELSGGQRQRVIIATALSCGAEFLIADEPTRNLDVTIQAGILKIIADLKEELGITVLYIANNMGLLSVTCDRVAVLQNGSIIETGPMRQVVSHPEHAYTKLLLKSLPDRDPAPPLPEDAEPIMEVRDLKKHYPLRTGFFGGKVINIKAVDGVDLDIRKGETLGIVGESGCGKTTFVNTILNLEKPTEGGVLFEGTNISALSKSDERAIRKDIQVVFQDPFWSLDPRMLIRDVVGEPLKVHEKLNATQYDKRVGGLLEMVGLPPEAAYRFPHEMSGGQRQRIAIARALALNARFVVLDEPTSSIDVVSQAQILQLLEKLKQELGLTYVLISHDLSVVHYMSTRIMVMYLGKVVEFGDADLLFENPSHPYTVALMGAIPTNEMNSLDDLAILQGNVPSAIDIPSGCRFHTRCERAMDCCKNEEPPLRAMPDGRQVACHLFDDVV